MPNDWRHELREIREREIKFTGEAPGPNAVFSGFVPVGSRLARGSGKAPAKDQAPAEDQTPSPPSRD